MSGRGRPRRPADKAAALQAVYAQVPAIECRGQCWDSCGPIELTRTERRRIAAGSGVEIADRLPLHLPGGGEVACAALTFPLRRCGVYELRPLICRLWGVLDGMPCTYGCVPERYLTMAEGYELLARAADLDGDAGKAAMYRTHHLADPVVAAAAAPLFRALATKRISPAEFARRMTEIGAT